MDISVIVPIYGAENYIERCLRSLFTQTKTNGVEFILVNDCTKDRSMEIARKVIEEFEDLAIRIIEHTENRHVAATRQTGIDAAIGEYTIQIDSDDWCEPTMLEELYCEAKNKNADIVICNYFNWDLRISSDSSCITNFDYIGSMLMNNRGLFGVLWNKLIKRSLYTNNNIKIDVGIKTNEDVMSMIRLYFYAKNIVYLSRTYLHHSFNLGSIVNSDGGHNEDMLKSVYFVDNFIKEKGVYALFERTLIEHKLHIKSQLLQSYKGQKQKEIARLFPELTKEIFSLKLIPITTKIPLFLASKHCLTLANTIWFFKKIFKKRMTL